MKLVRDNGLTILALDGLLRQSKPPPVAPELPPCLFVPELLSPSVVRDRTGRGLCLERWRGRTNR